MIPRGKFITLEGPEGGGKSTHTGLLVETMRTAGYPVISVREPGGTGISEAIRELLSRNDGPICPETELFLFLASRAQLVREVIAPALRDGTHVVCDRFSDSTAAYQGYGRNCDLEMLLKMNDLAVHGIAPDLTILLDLDVSSGIARIEHRHSMSGTGKDRIERETHEFHERVRNGFLALARGEPDRFRIIDASRPSDDVRGDIWKEVRRVIEG